MKGAEDVDEFLGSSNFPESQPQPVPINRIEHFSEINEDRVQITMLFSAFFLNVPGSENHVHRTSTGSEPALTLKDNSIAVHMTSKHRRRNRVGRVGQVLHGFWGV